MPGSPGYLPARAPIEVPRRPLAPRTIDTRPPGRTPQTSFRLYWADKERLRLIAERMAQGVAQAIPGMELDEGVGQITMSAALRALIRDKAREYGIVVDETDLPEHRHQHKTQR